MEDVLNTNTKLHTSRVLEFGHNDERTLLAYAKVAYTLLEMERFEEASSIYQHVRDEFEEIGFGNIIVFCELEVYIAITSRNCEILYVEGYNHVEQRFKYYEKLLEEINKDALLEVFNGIGSIYSLVLQELGHENIIVLRMGLFFGYMHSLMGKYRTSLATYANIYQKCLSGPNPSHPITVISCLYVAKTLRDLCDFQEARAILQGFDRKLESFDEPTLEANIKSRCEQGNVAFSEGRYADAKECYRYVRYYQTEKGVPENSLTLHAKRMMGNCHSKSGDYATALDLLTEVYIAHNREWPENRDILLTMSDIAEIMKEKRQYDKAVDMYKSMCQMSLFMRSDFIHIENEIAIILTKKHELEEAVTKFKILMEKCNGTSYPTRHFIPIQNGLATAYYEQGKYGDAIKIYEEIIDTRKVYLGHYHADILNVEYNLGRVLEKRNNRSEAKTIYENIRNLRRAIFHRAHPDCLSIHNHIAEILDDENVHDEAYRIYCDLHDTIECFHGPDRLNITEVEEKMYTAAEKMHGEPRLITATRIGNLEGIRYCLRSGDDVNRRDYTGSAPLHIACENGFRNVVLLLLKYGANYEIQNFNSQKPLDTTINSLIKDMLQQLQMLFSAVKRLEVQTLQIIIKLNSREMLESLLNAKDKWGYTTLHYASRKLSVIDNAALDRNVSIVHSLLNNGAGIASVTKEGYLALHVAVKTCNKRVFRILLSRLRSSSERKFLRIIEDQNNDTRSTLLHFAALNNLTGDIELLLQCRANPRAKNKLGKLPVQLASDNGVKELLRVGRPSDR